MISYIRKNIMLSLLLSVGLLSSALADDSTGEMTIENATLKNLQVQVDNGKAVNLPANAKITMPLSGGGTTLDSSVQIINALTRQLICTATVDFDNNQFVKYYGDHNQPVVLTNDSFSMRNDNYRLNKFQSDGVLTTPNYTQDQYEDCNIYSVSGQGHLIENKLSGAITDEINFTVDPTIKIIPQNSAR